MESTLHYTLVRSARKTLAIQIKSDGSVIVRAPLRMSEDRILQFVREKEGWIRAHLARVGQQKQERPDAEKLTAAQIQELADRACRYIPERVRYYAPLVGVTYGRITIRNQKTRWGSCSSKGNLNFNCLLMLAPPEVIDSVVVHELCHRKEMNHSKQFYAHVYRVFPRYDSCHKWLKENGAALLGRM